MDLMCEVAEIAEHFRWLTEEQRCQLVKKTHEEVHDEIGDAMIRLLHPSKKPGIDLIAAAHDKLLKIGKNYPAEKCKGRCDKYTAYVDE